MNGDKDKDQDYLDQILQETTEDINININLNDINVDEILAEGDLGGDITGEEGRNLQFLQDTQKNLNELAQIENSKNVAQSQQKYQIDQKKEKKETKKEFKLPKFSSPIEFVQYMETVYMKKQNESKENFFHLKQYQLHSKLNFVVLQFLPKTTLSSRFFKEGNIITSITASQDVIFTGNNLGKIRMYSCEKEYEYKSLSTDEIVEPNKRGVVCMDVSENIDYLVSGYMNGYIALWELGTPKCVKLITEEHEDCVIAVKFIRVRSKEYEMLSSDLSGVVKKITVSEGFFLTTIDAEPVMTNKDPIFLIEILKLSNEEKQLYETEEDEPIVVAFGSMESITIYQIEPEAKMLFVFEKPKYLSTYNVPDICFGFGYPPRNAPNDEKELKESNGVDLTKPHRLIAISWEKIIYIYKLPLNEAGAESPIYIGHYVNIAQINRMGFISNSILYTFDMHKNFKILNTGLLTNGDVKFEDGIPVSQASLEHKPELEDGQIIDQDILFQAYIPDKGAKDSKMTKPTYNQFIVSQMKTLYILGKKHFHYGKLLNWEQSLNNLQQRSEWMDALALGLDIYNGRNITLADIPIDENERKRRVGYILKGLILQYTVINTGADPSSMKREKYEEAISKFINICIEFCLEIDDVKYLQNQIQPIFNMKGCEELFIKKLEPFILCDKIKNQQLSKENISKIVDLYIKNKNYHILSQILTHLDIHSIDKEEIKDICITNNLIDPLIYIYMNNDEENYFFPISKIYDVFLSANEIDFVSYDECINKETVPAETLQDSKQYIGHKLMWYINMCLDGERYPSKEKINSSTYEQLVVKIYLWILGDEVLTNLLNFDSFSLFNLISRFFLEEKISTLLEKLDISQYKKEVEKIKSIDNLEQRTIVGLIMEKAKSLKSQLILQDLYGFIAKISTHLSSLSKDVILETAKYLLGFDSRKEEAMKEKDQFGLHRDFFNENHFIKTISTEINKMIETRKNKLSIDELRTLLSACANTSFVQVEIFLLNLTGEYIQCLDTYLKNEKMENRVESIFSFIDKVLKQIRDSKDTKKLSSFKEEVLQRIVQLSQLSIPEVVNLCHQWYDSDNMLIIDKLQDNLELQLQYIEAILDSYKEEDFSEKNKETEIYLSLLTKHIDLLCKLEKIEEILPNLKKRPSYPVETCLKMCLNAKAYDAAIYLYNSTGASQDALKLAVSLFKEHLEYMFNCINDSKIEEYDKAIVLHSINLNRCIQVLQNNSDKTIESETEQMWFDMLQIFYDMAEKIGKGIEKRQDLQIYFNNFHKIISDNIKELIEIMNSYVGIKKIIENVTYKYKNAELKEFKALLMQILSSYSYLKTILQCAKKLLFKTVGAKIVKYNKFIQKGNYYNMKKCDECGKEFKAENKDKVCLFRCGHKLHLICCIAEIDDLVCPICRKFKIENSVTSMEEEKIKIKKKKMENVEKNRNDMNQNRKLPRKNDKFEKLNSIDKRFMNSLTFLEKHIKK